MSLEKSPIAAGRGVATAQRGRRRPCYRRPCDRRVAGVHWIAGARASAATYRAAGAPEVATTRGIAAEAHGTAGENEAPRLFVL